MQRLLIDGSTLDLIVSDGNDFLNVLNAAGLLQSANLMMAVLQQLEIDRSRLFADDQPAAPTN
ncbi:MAG: hypothetical protein ABT11_19310 [Novosphingobium sp. SCN 66-18]|nr:MAG: hypothetical protein ABT11_19310 [Novosphingobium sp. SCN 66-18]PKP99225.1 MAG: hypothetical protein CVT74_08505 [Alphaproteobacteria bacterium HGW-Alphaproteobacteria-13]